MILTDTHTVDFNTLIARHALLSRLAERFGGFYDGYEYEVGPEEEEEVEEEEEEES
ncbi:MAG: hypothetical protein WBB32_12515 [Flavobacteriales bacterium]